MDYGKQVHGLLSGADSNAPQSGGALPSGLLSSPSLPQAQAAPSGVGAISAASKSSSLDLAVRLANDPTPQMAMKIAAQLHASGNPQAERFADMLQQLGGDPKALKQLADNVIDHLTAQ